MTAGRPASTLGGCSRARSPLPFSLPPPSSAPSRFRRRAPLRSAPSPVSGRRLAPRLPRAGRRRPWRWRSPSPGAIGTRCPARAGSGLPRQQALPAGRSSPTATPGSRSPRPMDPTPSPRRLPATRTASSRSEPALADDRQHAVRLGHAVHDGDPRVWPSARPSARQRTRQRHGGRLRRLLQRTAGLPSQPAREPAPPVTASVAGASRASGRRLPVSIS